MQFTDTHGVEVHVHEWKIAEPRGAVVIAHGASEHGGRYARFASALNEAGFSVWALDHRGHGLTGEGVGTGMVGPGGNESMLDDIDELVGLVREQVAGPVVLFGHSMGSIFTQAAVVRNPSLVDAYVLSGCPGPMEGAVDLIAGVQAAVDGGMADESVDLLGGFNDPFEPARTGYDWLSRDEAEVDAYLADRFCGDQNPLTYGYVLAMLSFGQRSMESEAIAGVGSLPVLLITGELDPVSTQAETVRELERRLDAAGLPVTSHYYPGARHEVLNETNRDEVTADVVAWLDSVV